MWHASVAYLTAKGRPAPVASLFLRDVGIGQALALRLLAGVGEGPVIETRMEFSVHARRSLSPEEIAGLDPAWLAIPPIDVG